MSMAYTIKRYVGFVSLVLVFVFVLSTEARAALYGFGIVEGNSVDPGGIAATLSLEVDYYDTIDIGNEDYRDRVLFTFINDGPVTSTYSITDIYFEDGTLLELATIFDRTLDPSNPAYAGLDFDQPVSPGNLTGWSTLDPKFYATDEFTVDSESPGILANGVNTGESLGLLYTLQENKNFDNVIEAIELGFTNPDPGPTPRYSLRIGIRVQGIGPLDRSDTLILTPEPASLLLGSIGIGMVIARCRKRKTLIES